MTRIATYLESHHACECGVVHAVTTRRVDVSPGSMDSLGETYKTTFGIGSGEILIVADHNTFEAAGAATLAALGKAGFDARVILVEPEPGHGTVEATQSRVEVVETALEGAGPPPIALGAGTISDLVKLASHRHDRPYAVVGTALSMNGYASGIAAVLVDGLKRTVPCRQPSLVVLDPQITSNAPPEMTAAGVGDLLSKPVSHTDWRLASLVRGDPYCQYPDGPVADAVDRVQPLSGAIARGEPGAVAVLAESLILSGFSMAMAGSSAPASGGEHLISHYLDMERHAGGQPVLALHGIQVALGTRLTLALYDRLRILPAEGLDLDRALATYPSTLADLEARLERDHAHLPGPVRDTILEQSRTKWSPPAQKRAELTDIRNRWSSLWSELDPILQETRHIEEAQAAAACPATPEEAGIDRKKLVRALRLGADIRNRYTVLDLARDLALLDDWAEDLVTSVFG